MSEPILQVRDLVTEFVTPHGTVHAVNEASFELYPGEILGIVGESGSGKTAGVLSILGLLPQPAGRVVGGQALFEGRDLLAMNEKELRRVRGNDIAMIFQDPVSSLNPVRTVGWQVREALRTHDTSLANGAQRERALELLRLVGIPNPERRLQQYPHEFSGGMSQRVGIAMAIANQPKILLADEPTTALDVTIQAQILEILEVARRETQAATILITHDLGVIAENADRMVVMYAGRVVESGTVAEVFADPRHPYTLGLLDGLPRLDTDVDRTTPIEGEPPNMVHVPAGCAFHPRCMLRRGRPECVERVPHLREIGLAAEPRMSSGPDARAGGPGAHEAACHFSDEIDRAGDSGEGL